MLYKFKSKATGDLIMLGPNGDQLLHVLGREPSPKGIIEPAHMPEARRLIEQALADADAAARHAQATPDEAERAREAVGLRQRLWPMVQMLERAQGAGEPVVWGV
ncbi:MAG: hypothetical protein RJA10_2114 [Pseudomonadota bacterium]|jgi:hypothetical protein